MAQAKGITFEEFRKQYETEAACREELFGCGSRMALFAPNVAVRNIIPFAPAIHISAGTVAARHLLQPVR